MNETARPYPKSADSPPPMDYKYLVNEAARAVEEVEDQQLKAIAFQKVLDCLLFGTRR
jgi:hypothetical protein